ncbi:MAG: antitoxin [Acidimicrobiia bacterium]
MGALDDMKDKAKELVGEHGDKIKEGLEKVGDLADEKTGGKHSDKIDQGIEKGKELIDKLGDERKDS